MNLDTTQRLKRFPENTQPDMAGVSHYRQALAHVGVGVLVVNRNGIIRYCNPMAAKITGLKAVTLIGQQFNLAMDKALISTVPLNFFALRSLKANTDFDVTINSKIGERRHLRIHVAASQDSADHVGEYILTLQDLTQLDQDAQETQRLKGLSIVGDVAARMAHEIRNPLGSIELFASSIGSEPETSPEVKALTTHISASVESINTIIENLLTAVNPNQNPDFCDIDLHEALKDSLFFANHLFSSNRSVRVQSFLNKTPLRVWGDQQLLKQVMLNLILNAIQAMPQGGDLVISSRQIEDECTALRYGEIRISDTGIGIAETDLGRVFDPYYTTKENGTGLGMAIVHNIISAHKGKIDIVSQQQQGTECIIRLPLKIDTDVVAEIPEEFFGLQTIQPETGNHHARTVDIGR